MVRMQRILHRLEYAAAWLAIKPLVLLPERRALAISGWAGRLIVAGIPALRRRIERGLTHAMPDLSKTQRGAIARAVGTQFGRVIMEYHLLDRLAAAPPALEVHGPGLAALSEARDDGRGVVLVSAHFGNWEMIRLALQERSISCAMIYRAFNNARFDRFVRGRMREVGEPVLTKGRSGMRAFVTHVARGGTALILVDQKQTGAPTLPFLGHPAETVLAAAELATRSKAALIPVRARRQPDGFGFDILFEDPIPAGPAIERMSAINARISTWIAADPGQWFWLHDRWRLRARR